MSRGSVKEKEQINSVHILHCCVGNPVLRPKLEGSYITAEYEGISQRLFCPHNQVEGMKCVRNAPAYLPRCRTATCLRCSLSLPLPLSPICITRPAVSNHSLSVTLNLICKCDMWGQNPVLCVLQPHTFCSDCLLRLHRYFWMWLFSSRYLVTAGIRASASPKLSDRPQILLVHIQNKPYKSAWLHQNEAKEHICKPDHRGER